MRIRAITAACVIIIFSTSLAFAQQHTATTPVNPSTAQKTPARYSFKIINAPENTFGYDIYTDGLLLIRQVTIPGMPGNRGFKTKAHAEKVASLVIRKLNAGEMPPTVTIEELKKLKVI